MPQLGSPDPSTSDSLKPPLLFFCQVNITGAAAVWRTDKLDFLAVLGTFFGILFVSVEIGLVIGTGFSLLKLLIQVGRLVR